MPTLIIGSGPAEDMRRPYIAEDELFSTCRETAVPGCVYRPPGDFDLRSYLKCLPAPWNKPSMLVTLFGQQDFVPRGLGAVDCPKVLIISDTHHGQKPLTKAVQAAISEPYDLVVLQYTPQHVHWFEEAGCKRVAYIPCFGINPIRLEPKEPTLGIVFVGSTSPLHVKRNRILRELKEDGLDVEVISGVSRQQAANIYNQAKISLNIPLNGDTNLRTMEIQAAGGVAVVIDDKDDIPMEWVNYKKKRMAVACKQFDYYWKTHSPTQQVVKLWDELSLPLNPKWNNCDRTGLFARLTAYEHLQELRRLEIDFTSDMKDLL